MKTLCVYCTRSGLTKKIILPYAEKLSADVLEITDGKEYRGVFGYIKACVVGLRKTLPELEPINVDLTEYDRLILGAPIWTENVSPIARAFLQKYHTQLPDSVYLVVTHMSDISYEKKIQPLCDLLGEKSAGWISVSTKKSDDSGKIQAFLERICD